MREFGGKDPFENNSIGSTSDEEARFWQSLSFTDDLSSYFGETGSVSGAPQTDEDDYGYDGVPDDAAVSGGEKKSGKKKTKKARPQKEKKEKKSGKGPAATVKDGLRSLANFWIRLSMPARVSVIAAFVVILAGIVLFGVSFAPPEQEVPKIVPGVTIDGYEVSGMTQEEAYDALRRVLDEKFAGTTIILTYGGEKWTYEADELGIGDDLDSVIAKALAVRRPARLFDRLVELFKKKSEARDLHTSVIVSEVLLHAKLTQECGVTDEQVIDGNVSFDADAVNEQGLFTITAPRSGRTINMSLLISQIRNAINEGGVHEIAVTETVIRPANTLADLKLSVSKIAETELSVADWSDTQKKNAAVAAARIDGTVIDAGSRFSANSIMGTYTGENGYALTETDKGYTVEGLELTATVIYRAGLLANMDLLTRFSPEKAVTASQPGLDAYLDTDHDLVLRNTSDYPLYLSVKTEGDVIRVSVYGMPLPDSQTVSLETQILSYAEAPKQEEIPDDGSWGLQPGETKEVAPSLQGCTVRLWRVYRDKFGNETARNQIGQDTIYPPVRGKIIIGPAA